MAKRIIKGNLQIMPVLFDLIMDEILPGTNINPDQFWDGFGKLVHSLAPKNKALIAKRDKLQSKIDKWHEDRKGQTLNFADYKKFLFDIGYLVKEGAKFAITTSHIDPEISSIPGPQLVVPVMNARFALNAANARWGSLYDALYGTDIIAEINGLEKGKNFNMARGSAVIRQATEFLDKACPLSKGRHEEASAYKISDSGLVVTLTNGDTTSLKEAVKFVGFIGNTDSPTSVLLKNHGLHIEIQIDREHPIGTLSPAGVKDVVLESAMSAIQDCEDSVAAVDGDDKALVYRNWLGLMKGDLSENITKGDQTFTRSLAKDRDYKSIDASTFSLPGRSLLLVRNVGHLMTNNAILLEDGSEIPEGIMDAVITTLCAIHDFNKNGINSNSRNGSIYIVKPKMHGPEEAAFANEIFCKVEDLLSLPRDTIKVGVMDEERRTTVNLKECIRAVQSRIFFINTGFLDRCGDEIHTSMYAGPFLPKEEIKAQPWIKAYEDWNVDIGLECGFSGKAQIGKGMWPKPDEMRQMNSAKVSHPEAGANCAWVPSPTAATIHVMHYHDIDVFARQAEIAKRPRASLDDILTIPLLDGRNLSDTAVSNELDNNAQGLLGYMVRWVEMGIGCSKVPDINNVGLMEDRATLRISSQHITNWLLHGICSESQVLETLERMAKVVDGQNAGDPGYKNMAPNFDDSVAFQAAKEIIFEGRQQPSGYTEPVLHRRRLEVKTKTKSG